MKKMGLKMVTVALVLLMAVSVLLTGCGTTAPAASTAPETSESTAPAADDGGAAESKAPSSEGGKTIAFSLKTITNDDFQKAIADSIQKAVEDSGNTFELVTAGDQTNVANQVKQIEDLIAKKVDALIVSPMDANAVIPALEKAKAAGIPVVLVDQTIEDGHEDLYVTYIGTDNTNAGKEAGKKVAEWLGNKGNVLIVRGANGSSAGDQRVDGFKQGLEGTDIVVAGEQAGDWKNDKAMQVTENMLQANSDVQAIFTASDGMLDGILQALQNAGKTDVKIMSVDGSKKAVEMIEAGDVTGTMAQFPQIMGGKAVETLLGVIDGSIDPDSVEKYIDSGTAAYTQDNLDEAKESAF
ncbi:sugar ABC transporter substrate-binding protein [Christensenella intestinihominis]|uniref:sugar ABC transporter substrate-binding protein n=1 Tax=Christensenella intestinihominis TaxID=1851429 RepID=UPI0008316E1B|nr:sugar ABC transporter substrate-binding protein [Christensenella intestinihominis]